MSKYINQYPEKFQKLVVVAKNIFKQSENTTYTSITSSNMFRREKAKLFNSFFSKQCPVKADHGKFRTSPGYLTDKRLSTITFSVKEIRKIICSLDLNKDPDHDN